MSNLKTIEQWNAEQKCKYDALQRKPPPPLGLGVACECGYELRRDIGVCYGSSPAFLGIICRTCGRRGYIGGWSGPDCIVLLPNDKA